MSLMTSREIGEPGRPARPMPINPPIDVPSQWTVSASSRASSVTMSATYAGSAYPFGSARRSDSPRPTTSGQITRQPSCIARASTSKSRPWRDTPCAQTRTRSVAPPARSHCQYAIRCRPRLSRHCTRRSCGCFIALAHFIWMVPLTVTVTSALPGSVGSASAPLDETARARMPIGIGAGCGSLLETVTSRTA